MKQEWKPGTMIYPLPSVLVSCGTPERSNLLTVAWTGTLCTNPALCYISVRPERHSYPMIIENMEFTINITTEAMAEAVDWCGVRSGRDHDKWLATGLTPEPGLRVSCPSVAESPLSIECRVRSVTHLGSHDMILGEVLCVRADNRYIDPATESFDLSAARLLNYSHGHYYGQGEELGHFGFSVRKKPRRSRPTEQ